MKKTLITITLAAASVGAFAQGRVNLQNDLESLYQLSTNCLAPDAPLTGQPIPISGPLPSGVVLEVGLYGGTTSTSMTLQTSVLLNPPGGGGGYGAGQPPVTHVHIDGVPTSYPGSPPVTSAGMPGYVPGATVYFQVFVWDSAYATPQEATADGSYEGQNNIFQMIPGTSIAYPAIDRDGSTTWTNVGDESPLYVGATAITNAPPCIGSQPQSITVQAGDTAAFDLTVFGAAPFTYQWLKDSTALTDAGNISGARTWTLTLSNVLGADRGGYSVVVTNVFGSVTSVVATLSVADPFITTQPSNQTVNAGQAALFSINAAGTSPLSFQWFKDGAPLTDGVNISGTQTATLTLSNVGGGDAGGYSVIVSNTYGSVTSIVAALTVADPFIITQPVSRSVSSGAIAQFSVVARGTAPLTYQWLKDGVSLSDGGGISGALTPTLTLSNLTPTEAGGYRAVVANSYGSTASAVARLTVLIGADTPPYIGSQPQSITVHGGDTAAFDATVLGTLPLSFQWTMNGRNIPGATSNPLIISNVAESDLGVYAVVVTNAFGTTNSSNALLSMYPTVGSQPQSITVHDGDTAEFDLTVFGTPPLIFQWTLNGTNIPGATSNPLIISNVAQSDLGVYAVVVRNDFGTTTSSNALLSMYPQTAVYSILHTFTGTDGAFPGAGLLLSGQTLYGTANEGGPNHGDYGTVFKLNTDGSGFTVLKALAGGSEGVGPSGPIALGGATLYGATYMGGTSDYGVVYRLNTNGSGYTVLRSFSTNDGPEPAGVTLYANNLYGTTELAPVLFKIGTDGSQYTILRWFLDGGWCSSSDFLFLGGQLYGTGEGGSFGQGGIFKMDLNGNTFTVLTVFSGLEGEDPEAGLVSADGTLYGTMAQGGSNGCGTVFRINADGSGLRVLKHFAGPDGSYPISTLVLCGNNLIGTTEGSSGLGTIFMLNTDGTGFTLLRSFSGSDGTYPVGRLTLAGSTLYGMTHAGGSANEGVVFRLSVAPLGILVPPQTQTAEAGSAVRLWVGIVDEPGWLYQWLFDGTNLTGWTTNCSLELTNVQFSGSGAYTVIVSNRFGAATSCRAMLNVIAPVERRPVAGINLMAQAGNFLGLDYRDNLGPTANWATMATMTLSNTSQFYFDLSAPLSPQRFYRAWQSGTPNVVPSLSVAGMVPAITLTGNIGDSLRLDYINQIGPTNAWVTLATVTLSNTSQLYFDTSALGQPARLWRVVPVP